MTTKVHTETVTFSKVHTRKFAWGTDIHFRPSLVRMYPAPLAFLRMQAFARRAVSAPHKGDTRAETIRRAGSRALFVSGERSAIAQLLVVNPQRQASLVTHALGFVDVTGSADGLDGFLLTGIVALRQAGYSSLARRATQALLRVPRPVRPDQVPVWNPATSRVSFFADAGQALAALGLGSTPGHLPSDGSGRPGPGDPGLTEDSHDTCVNVIRFGASIAGTGLGAAFGAVVAGASLSAAGTHGGTNEAASGGAAVVGALGGAQGGDVLGNNIAQIVCPPPATAASAAAPTTAAPKADLPSSVPDEDPNEGGPAPEVPAAADPATQKAYADGFAEGYAAAGGQPSPTQGDTSAAGWGAGFADGFGAAAAATGPAPATTGVPADNASGQPEAPTVGDPTPPDNSGSDNSGHPDGPQGSDGNPPPTSDFGDPDGDGGDSVGSPSLPFGPGIGQHVTPAGDNSFTVVGIPTIDGQGDLVNPGLLGLPAGQRVLAALASDDGDGEGDGVGQGPTISLGHPKPGPIGDPDNTDPDNNPRAISEALRLMGEGIGRVLLAGVALNIP